MTEKYGESVSNLQHCGPMILGTSWSFTVCMGIQGHSTPKVLAPHPLGEFTGPAEGNTLGAHQRKRAKLSSSLGRPKMQAPWSRAYFELGKNGTLLCAIASKRVPADGIVSPSLPSPHPHTLGPDIPQPPLGCNGASAACVRARAARARPGVTRASLRGEGGPERKYTRGNYSLKICRAARGARARGPHAHRSTRRCSPTSASPSRRGETTLPAPGPRTQGPQRPGVVGARVLLAVALELAAAVVRVREEGERRVVALSGGEGVRHPLRSREVGGGRLSAAAGGWCGDPLLTPPPTPPPGK
eukprot:gene22851-biopygen10286